MNRFLEMEIFLAVVDAGSFVAAAERLQLSKAALSRHLAALEERLGVRLLNRTTRRLSLTDEGGLFYGRARDILAATEQAEAEAGRHRLEPRGRLRINAPVSFGILHLAPLWQAFAEACPKVELAIDLNDRLVDLVEEGYDLAVRIADLKSSSLIGRRLATTRMRLCAAPAYLKAQGTPDRPEDLARHRLIGYSNLATRDEWLLHGPGGPVRVATRPVLRSNNGDTCRMLALRGGGILLQPSFMLHQDLASGRLIELLPSYRGVEFGVYAVYPSRQQLSPKVGRLVAFLAQAFAQVDWSDG